MSSENGSLENLRTVVRELTAEARELQSAAGGAITDAVSGWVAAQYAAAARENLAEAEGARRWEILHAFARDWSLLRGGDHAAARLQLDREDLDWRRANGEAQKEKEFREWLKRPEIRKEFWPDRLGGLSAETLAIIERELKLL